MTRRTIVFAGILALMAGPLVFGGSTGTSGLITQQGSGSTTGQGDYIASSAGLNSSYLYFVEVPPGLARLVIEVFDADIGAGAGEAAANRDRDRGGFDTAASYTLTDPSGAVRTARFTTGNTVTPTGADNAWLTFYDGTGNSVRDNFTTAAYTNNDGTNNWATNWTENDAGGGGATGGAIQITGGQLRLGDNVAGSPTIEREVNLSATGLNFTQAFFTFTYSTSGNLENADTMQAQVSNNGGTSWTTLETFINDSSGARSYDITAFIASNTRIRFVTNNEDATEFFFVDNVEINDGSGGAITAGHWRLAVDMSSAATGGDDINALGIRAHDGTSGSGGTELNVYQDSFAGYGTNGTTSGATASRSYTHYSYITSGCGFDKNDFDWDSNSGATGSITFTSAGRVVAAATRTVGTLSTNDNWRNDALAKWTTDQIVTDYGIWTQAVTVNDYPGNANYGVVYLGSDQAANPPPGAGGSLANTFRMYFPNDAGAAPVKPYVDQVLTYGGSGGNNGPNPPVAGTQSIFTVTVRVVNPAAQAITFSAANLVTANVPGGGVVYGGNAQVSQGSVTAQPAVGGTGNVTWNPGTLSAGGTALLSYLLQVTPPSGARVIATGTPALATGTRAQFVDETGNTTQARATYLFGPLCELAVTPAVITPAVVTSVEAHGGSGGTLLEWRTASEVGVAGFHVFRWDRAGQRYVRLNATLVPAQLGGAPAGRYQLLDPGAGADAALDYLVVEVGQKGERLPHGPFHVVPDAQPQRDALSFEDTPRAALLPSRQAAERLSRAQTEAIVTRSATAAGASALKIGVRETGLQFLSIDQVAGPLGLTPAKVQRLIDGGGLALTTGGRSVAWMASPWDAGIVFYGEASTSIYARDRVYWLKRGAGDVMRSIGGSRATPVTPGVFLDTLHAEEDRLGATLVSTDPEADYWFWDYLIAADPNQGAKTFTIAAPGAALGERARLKVDLQGATTTRVANEHHVRVHLNGVVVGEDSWSGITAHRVDLPVDPALLVAGANSVEVEGVLDAGVPYSIFYLDGITLSYPRRERAENEALAFRGDGSPVVTVAGFADARILAFDLSDPLQPRTLRRAQIGGAAGDWSVSVVPKAADRLYLAASRGGWKEPAWVRGALSSKLASRKNGADYVILTTAAIEGSAESLALLRGHDGLRTAVVDVEDVFDEFGDGTPSPHAIQQFLKTAYETWSPAPRYLLIAGKGSFDYRDNLGLGGNLVPPLMVSTPWGLFASDNRLGDVVGDDGVPEIAVGRVPVVTAQELADYVHKLEAYAAADRSAPKALLVADAPSGGTDFGIDSERVAEELPDGYAADRVYLVDGGIDAARTMLRGGFQAGAELVSYVGHGGLDRLSSQGLLTSDDISSLGNGERLPILTALTCTINRFEVPGFTALGELLVTEPDGGAAASWAPTGLSNNADAGRYGPLFYRVLREQDGGRLGDALLQAAAAYAAQGGDRTLLDVYTLLGDPALTVAAAPPADAGGEPSPPGVE